MFAVVGVSRSTVLGRPDWPEAARGTMAFFQQDIPLRDSAPQNTDLFKEFEGKTKWKYILKEGYHLSAFCASWWTFLKHLFYIFFAQLVITFQCSELGADASKWVFFTRRISVLLLSTTETVTQYQSQFFFDFFFSHLCFKLVNHSSGFTNFKEDGRKGEVRILLLYFFLQRTNAAWRVKPYFSL